ncbi:MAG: PAS domain-containing protein, partial [Candidatus Eremiobacteraeota bacterium]|nr:PAS domain-containing protein [Candidatus Eremiobacteraeota bacterium]
MAGKRVVPIRRAEHRRARLELLRAYGFYDAADGALLPLLETLRAGFDAPFAALFASQGKGFTAKCTAGDSAGVDIDALKRFAASVATSEDEAPQAVPNDDGAFCAAAVKLQGTIVPAVLCVVAREQPSDASLLVLANVRNAYGAILESRMQIAAGFDAQLERIYSGVEHLGESVVITEIDPKHSPERRLVFCGERFARASGYSVEEVLAHGMRLFVGPRTDVETIERAARELQTQRHAHFEVELYRKDGTTFWSEWFVQSYDIPGGLHRWFAVTSDLTEQRDRSRETVSLRRALDESSDFVLTTEAPAFSDGDPVVTYANEPFLKAFGYTAETLVGQPLTVLAGPGTDRSTLQELHDRFVREENAGAEVLFYRHDGSAVWVELTAQPVYGPDSRLEQWVIVARDVGRRRKTQEQLLVLSTAIQHANDAIVIYAIDSSGRRRPRVVYINDAVLKNSGFTRDEVFSQSTGTGPRTDKAAVRMLREKLAKGESVRTRIELYRKTGTTYWAEIDARPIMDERGRVTHWISIERDISDVVAREQQLERERRTFANLHAAVAELLGALDRKTVAEAFFRGVDTVGECSSDKLRVRQEMGEAQLVRSDDSRQVLLAAPDPDRGTMQLALRRRDGEGFDDVALLA